MAIDNPKALFDQVSIKCSRISTHTYSTSFSMGIRCLGKELRDPIHAIYGFVRFADEIVDSFQTFNKETLLNRFEAETYLAIEEGISLNPILNSFQKAVNQYQIERSLIEKFLSSMRMDLTQTDYNPAGINDYILGSAEVVGLMCLRVFCNGDSKQYESLKPLAMKLGSAFQKINFLRDIQSDYQNLGRNYFPNLDFKHFNDDIKKTIEIDIESDFKDGYEGIKRLPRKARFGVYIAYLYYRVLLKKIKNLPSQQIMTERIRISNGHKFSLLIYSYFRHQLNLI